jgi:uncharacterized protein
MTVPTIDTHEFTRRADAASGREPVAAFERLASLLIEAPGALDWRLDGRSEVGADGARRAFLRLGLGGTVRMRCVRCLEPVEVTLEGVRDYRLVATEAQAEREDADDDEVDLLVASRRFDLAALLEDEAIMALPPAPRHDDCRAPEPAAAAAPAAPEAADAPDRGDGRPGPFAALAGLKGALGPPAGPQGSGPEPRDGAAAPPAGDAPTDPSRRRSRR